MGQQYVNKQNCRICSEESPHEYENIPLRPKKVGRHFFANTQGRRVTVNRVRYRTMLNDYLFWIVVAVNDMEEFWFQDEFGDNE